MSNVNEWIKERRRINEAKPSGPGCWADSYNTLPALLTAVEKVLEFHKPRPIPGTDFTCCVRCSDAIGKYLPYPCPTVAAIEGAINHE